jgi:hypothetical protein
MAEQNIKYLFGIICGQAKLFFTLAKPNNFVDRSRTKQIAEPNKKCLP